MEPNFKIVINGKDATRDLTPYVETFAYTDRVAGQSDEAEFTVDNTDGRFTGANASQDWRFAKGDTLDLSIGYGDVLTLCGTFTIDQIDAHYQPQATVTVRSLAAGINSPLRTKKTTPSEGKSLKQIAQAIADAHGFTIDDGTSFTSRETANWKTERDTLTTASRAIYNVLAQLQAPTQPATFSAAIAAALAQYSPIIETSHSLTAKGKASDGAILRNEANVWAQAWRNQNFPEAKEAVQIARSAADNMVRFAASLQDVDKTTTRSKLDIVTSWHTQDNETDLEYMARIAKAYGILFSVRGSKMIFTSVYDVEAAETLTAFTAKTITAANFSDKQTKVYAGAEVVWHDPESGEAIVSRFVAEEPPATAMPGSYSVFKSVNEFGTGEVLKVKQRVETQAQADEVAKAAIHASVTRTMEGEITVTGSPNYCAGINIEIQGFGMFDGKWAVVESRHNLEPSGGYVTSMKIKRGK